MLIALTGRIAAGKETLTGFLRDKGFEYLETSQLLKQELTKRGMELSRENMQDLGDELRDKDGAGALMKIFLERLGGADNLDDRNIIIDSLRNPGEVRYLKNNVQKFILIGIDAPQKLRFERIIKRDKPSDPKTWEEFLKVDERDFCDAKNPMGQRVGECLELADHKVFNDGGLRDSMNKIKEIWEEIKERC